MDIVDSIYDVAASLPQRETSGLWGQMTRAAVSVPTNIAEGRARSTARDFASFLAVARSSAMELDTLVTVAQRRNYIDDAAEADLLSQIAEVSKMLSSLRRRILTKGASS
jgi:four helix bundle protein